MSSGDSDQSLNLLPRTRTTIGIRFSTSEKVLAEGGVVPAEEMQTVSMQCLDCTFTTDLFEIMEEHQRCQQTFHTLQQQIRRWFALRTPLYKCSLLMSKYSFWR